MTKVAIRFGLSPIISTARQVLCTAVMVGALLPAAARAYELPVRGDSLKPGERFNTFVHKSGIQAEGKDIGARRHVSDSSVWPWLKTNGADSKVLTNWVVYGKPVYAMAAGRVVGCWRNAPQNVPGSYHAQYVNKKIPGGGNHLWILQNDGVYALYAHFQPGSMPATLCPHAAQLLSGTRFGSPNPDILPETKVTRGARVAVGQFLGRIGNSGASEGGPHLHVHMEKGGKPVPMRFRRGLTTPFRNQKAKLNGPWAPLAGKTMPKTDILIWPPLPIGNYTFNGVRAADYQRLFEHRANSGLMPKLITCKSNGATYNTTWIPAEGSWVSHHGMTAAVAAAKHALYTSKGFKRTSSYTCGKVSVAVWRK